MKLPIVEVRWKDAWIGVEDLPLKRAKKLKPVGRRTVGYLVEITDDEIILCTDVFDKGKEVSAPMVIPLAWVTKYVQYG